MPQNSQLIRRDNTVRESEIPSYIGKLREFFGHNALTKAQADLDKDLKHHGSCYQQWAQRLRPWLFALRLYDQITKNGIHRPVAWPAAIREMIGDAVMVSTLQQYMPDDVRAKYRQDLLSRQHNDFLVEVHTAWHYYLEGFDIQWYPLGHEKCPEFRVFGGGFDFDVECRRFSWDVSNYVKTAAVADVCDAIHKVLQSYKLWGEVKVEFSQEFSFTPAHMRKWAQTVAQALDAGQSNVLLNDGIALTLKLMPSPSPKFTQTDLMELVRKERSEVSFLVSGRTGDLGVNPVTFQCYSPRKTRDELRDYIYKTLKDKVTTQLSADRAGIVVVKFSGVKDPTVFDESEGMQDVCAKLFNQKHLAAMVLRCEDVAQSDGGSILHSTPAIVFRNPETRFPGMASVKHLSSSRS